MSEARIVEKRKLGKDYIYFVLREPVIASLASPGQFVMVKAGEGWDPLLRRPLGILWAEDEHFALLFKVVGRGTGILKNLDCGNWLDVIGPLGNSFSWNDNGPFLLIAGGRGLVPIYFLAHALFKRSLPFVFCVGFKVKEELDLLQLLERKNWNVAVACEEKDEKVFCGTVLDVARMQLRQNSFSKIYVCGPHDLLRSMAVDAEFAGLPIEASFEALMGCGYGLCLSCVLRKKNGEGYFHICKEGPVIALEEVSW
ncbi:MAG: dihydroorotate dehydrogenase electron transfer subunit [Candidatus Atribacteria bacterium]|jgi:dihydroorotate dehydrogenase electron transfer subunit|nr:dihydroorotate dehydrogenase electron transfer subunit [Candidatus Atribacteria bacterium]